MLAENYERDQRTNKKKKKKKESQITFCPGDLMHHVAFLRV